MKKLLVGSIYEIWFYPVKNHQISLIQLCPTTYSSFLEIHFGHSRAQFLIGDGDRFVPIVHDSHSQIQITFCNAKKIDTGDITLENIK